METSFMERLRRLGIDANRVAPKLYVGSYQPNDQLIARAGFTHVVRVAKELEKCEFPLDDAIITQDQLEVARQAADEVVRGLAKGGRVLVTCAMGLNRSALVAALAMMKYHFLSGQLAISQIRQSTVPRMKVLGNDSFVMAILSERPAATIPMARRAK